MRLKWIMSYMVLLLNVFWITNCKPEDIDKGIKTQLAMKSKTELNYAGLQFTVAEGVLTVGGKSPTEKAKNEVLKEVKGIAGVQQVVDQTQIAPVLIGTDYALKKL